MKSMMKSTPASLRSKRLIALMLALTLLLVCAQAEEMDQGALDALSGMAGMYYEDTDIYSEGGYPASGVDQAAGNSAASGQAAYDYAYYGINVDADIRLGYVASSTGSLNPFSCTDRDLVCLNQLVFESVVELDGELKPAPLLADSWTVEGNVWTFKLRSGIVFHNGASLTAQDVVMSYQAYVAAGESNPYYGRLQLVKGMEAVDDLTLRVTSTVSGYVTLYAMTFPVVQYGTLYEELARGTGPYWYTEYSQGSGVRLEANPLWWKNDAEVHSIAAINFVDSGAALEALHTDQIDMIYTQSSNAALSRRLSAFTGMDYSTTTFEMLVPNLTGESPMGDIRMRQAVMYAIDRANIAENGYRGMGVQCEVPVNPSSWLYESQSAIYYYSPERALQLALDCGWSDLSGDGTLSKIDGIMLRDLKLTLRTYNEPTNTMRENAANMIADYLGNIGIQVEVKCTSREYCLSHIKSGDYDLALVAVNLSEVPDLSDMLYSKSKLNLNSFKNDRMNELIEQVPSAQTDTELKALYSEIQMLCVERLPVLGLVFRTGTVLSTRSLAGLSGIRAADPLNGIEFLSKEG